MSTNGNMFLMKMVLILESALSATRKESRRTATTMKKAYAASVVTKIIH